MISLPSPCLVQSPRPLSLEDRLRQVLLGLRHRDLAADDCAYAARLVLAERASPQRDLALARDHAVAPVLADHAIHQFDRGLLSQDEHGGAAVVLEGAARGLRFTLAQSGG